MFDDPIVEEIRRYRKEHAAKYGNDIHRIFEAFREMEKQSGHGFLNPGPKLLSDRKLPCVAEDSAEYKTKTD
jgi:hypothetical protein